MTAAISYESVSSIVETDAHAELRVSGKPNAKYVQVTESDGTIRLIPLSLLHDSERAILENPGLYNQLRRGLTEFAEGQSVSSDWLFADE